MLSISLTGYLISAMFVTLEFETMYFIIALCAATGKLAPSPVNLHLKEISAVGVAPISFF